MRFALCGIDDQSSLLLRAIADSARHQLIAAADVSPAALAGLGHSNVLVEPWESLLARSDADAVIFSAAAEQTLREEQLKRFTQEAIPLLVMHPACDVMFAYEVEMMRREAGGIIVPFASGWWHPASIWLREWAATQRSRGAAIEQTIWERRLPDRTADAFLEEFSRDVWLIRSLIGQVRSVSVAGVVEGNSESVFANATIHCQGDGAALARWSAAPGSLAHASRVLVVSAEETANLTCEGGEDVWKLELRGATNSEQSFDSDDGLEAALDAMQRIVEKSRSAVPDWSEACLDLEAVDSVRRSARRKRTVDVHTEEATEDQTFKAFMAAGGCLILVAVVFAFIFLAVFEGFRVPLQDAARSPSESSGSGWPLWARLWPVYPLAFFLLLQFLLVLARRSPTKKS